MSRSADSDTDHLYRLVLVGDTMVGKSCFLKQFKERKFSFEHKQTLDADFAIKVIEAGNALVKVQVWDTSDHLRYGRLTQSYYANLLGMAMGIIVMFDITNKKSYDSIEQWLAAIKTLASPDVIVGIVGNKADLDIERQVQNQAADSLSRSFGYEYFEVSSKSADDVDQIVSRLTLKIKAFVKQAREASAARHRENAPEMYPPEGRTSIVDLSSTNEDTPNECCRAS